MSEENNNSFKFDTPPVTPVAAEPVAATADGEFPYAPGEHELERASNSYLMSVIAVMAGLPLPIINLIASVIFFLGNRKGTYFIRWHCTQALLSQLSLFPLNSIGFWWTIHIAFGSDTITTNYIAYLITLIVINLVEFVATIYAAVQTRKGHHVQMWIYSGITNLIVKP